jgi:N6-L-threonylcarbamoyladenine synthase
VRAALTGLASKYVLPFLAPPPKFCSDNGLMVAWTGLQRLQQGLGRPPPASAEQVSRVQG